jgi:hypothetical protein
MTDDELRSVLRIWKAQPAPESLRGRVLPRRSIWTRWLISGEIRVPVPIAVAALCLLLLIITFRTFRPEAGSLSDFQQVQQLRPRIVRTVDETR